ncbi:uncharacterized protein [Lepeophtheirus salmonis]|uniref:uncharacterized protein isoform X2 n=1 Tax=Lepeophtheirus salmonis TaxID=72036 RepID=UPI003AF3B027
MTMINKLLVPIRLFSASAFQLGKYMDSNATSKVVTSRSRMIRNFVEMERRKLEKARKNAIIERKNRTVLVKNYDKPHKFIMFEENKKSRNYNELIEGDLRMLMARSDFQENLSGLSFKITKVRVHPSYKCLYIFWITDTPSDERSINEKTDNIRVNLRHELEILNNVGRIPELIFVKDVEYLRLKILEDNFSYVQKSMGPEKLGNEPDDFSYNKKSDLLRFQRDDVMDQDRFHLSQFVVVQGLWVYPSFNILQFNSSL